MADMCNTCGLPQELCVCKDVSKKDQQITVTTEERTHGRTVTVASGFDTESININELSSEFKSQFACGGTHDGDTVELQGDHSDSLEHELQSRGYELA